MPRWSGHTLLLTTNHSAIDRLASVSTVVIPTVVIKHRPATNRPQIAPEFTITRIHECPVIAITNGIRRILGSEGRGRFSRAREEEGCSSSYGQYSLANKGSSSRRETTTLRLCFAIRSLLCPPSFSAILRRYSRLLALHLSIGCIRLKVPIVLAKVTNPGSWRHTSKPGTNTFGPSGRLARSRDGDIPA